ncbi:MAG: flavodoxin family protein [Spirochaetales bacterium]|uniref:Flavodoxin family protein n=1 Tax=Candidatus Thalassospirochaeta sargassi TaxID=3119039 RepID=A0AAJ1IEA3_9SPIO|nr:flavodoxin family protein [Spirochaetales bacterium]
MKVIGINGSPSKDGNTVGMMRTVFKPLEAAGHECEVFNIGGKAVHGCTNCGWCKTNHEGRCALDDDCINEAIAKMAAADAVIIGSPTYFASLTTETKALVDRAGRVCRGQGLLKHKIGAAVTPARRAGTLNVFQSINNFFLVQEMIVPGSSYWNVGMAAAPGDFENDAEGQGIMKTLGENISWLLEKLN